jgi:ubiquinone/menaquinone biosynthesis C-methylase UbiE
MGQDKIWEYFQNERIDVFSGSIPRLKYLATRADKLLGSAKRMALNIGVGNGWLEEYLTREGWKVQSLDPNQTAMARLREKEVIGNVGNVQALPYRDSVFDVVFCSEVLEHLTNNQLERGLKEIFRVLMPGGYLLGTVPSQEKLGDNEVVCPNCGQIFHRWGHLRSLIKQSFQTFFQEG